jgi:hypothetical protein
VRVHFLSSNGGLVIAISVRGVLSNGYYVGIFEISLKFSRTLQKLFFLHWNWI